METPDASREGPATRVGRAREEHGLAAAAWVGRGDEVRGLSILALAAGVGAFVCLFLPWLEFAGRQQLGWNLPLGSTAVLLAALRLAALWRSTP